MKAGRMTLTQKFIAALALAATLSFLACDNRYATSSLVINEIIDPNLIDPVVYVALSRAPDFTGGVKTYSASYDMSTPSVPALSFDSITWENKDEKEAGEFWLFVAQDFDSSGFINDGDLALPAMRLVLRDGETTTIERLVFDTSGPPFKLIGMDFAAPKYTIGLFIESPSLVSESRPLFLRIGTDPNLSDGSGNFTVDLPIVSPELVSGFSFSYNGVPNTHALLWLDYDNSTTLNIGDWISSPSELTVPILTPDNRRVMWSGQTVP